MLPDSELRDALARQFHSSLAMVEQAIASCPETLWLDESQTNRYWHIAYHVLFCTHLYLQPSPEGFRPWAKSRENYHHLGPLPWPPHERVKADQPYAKDEMLELVRMCREEVCTRMVDVDFAAPSGFPWLPFGKLELQLYNLRHLQHHAGQLADRLRAAGGTGVAWVR